jgi:hypothetical protein
MKYFLAKIVHQIVNGSDANTQFDEQLRLVCASDAVNAIEKAKRLGMAEEEIFFNEDRKPVQWKFIGVSELYEVNEENEGTEVWSRITEQDHAEAFIETIRRKSEALRLRYHPDLISSL